jgi:hypothetical protein
MVFKMQRHIAFLVAIIGLIALGLSSLLAPSAPATTANSMRSVATLVSRLSPLHVRVAYLKVKKTGSTTLSFLLDNAAKRRRLLTLVWYRQTTKECNELRSTSYIRDSTKESPRCDAQMHFEPDLDADPPPEPAHMALNHIRIPGNVGKIRPWYARQMNGPSGDDTGLAPILLVCNFRDPWEHLQSAYKHLYFDPGRYPTFSVYLSTAKRVRGQTTYLGLANDDELTLDEWWAELGAHTLWLKTEDYSNSLVLLAHVVGLELFELTTMRTQVSSTYLATWTTRPEADIMVFTESERLGAIRQLDVDYKLVKLAEQSYTARLAEAQQAIGMDEWNQRVHIVNTLTDRVTAMCTSNSSQYHYPTICERQLGTFVGRQKEMLSVREEFDVYARETEEWSQFLKQLQS